MAVTDETPLGCEMAAVMVETAVRRGAYRKIRAMLERRGRRSSPRPGGAAREMVVEIDDPDNPEDVIQFTLPRQRDGGGILVVHRMRGGYSLHSGYILRVPHVELPESVRIAANGMELGAIVELQGTGLQPLAHSPIDSVVEAPSDGSLLFHLERITVMPRLGDFAPGDPA